MKEHEIVSAVEQGTDITSHEHAERAVHATLAVLGQRLAGGEPGDLAAQLPPALAEALPATSSGEPFGINEFYQRVADEEALGCTPEQARQHARSVASALKTGITGGEFDDVVSQLPSEYNDLVSTGGPVHH